MKRSILHSLYSLLFLAIFMLKGMVCLTAAFASQLNPPFAQEILIDIESDQDPGKSESGENASSVVNEYCMHYYTDYSLQPFLPVAEKRNLLRDISFQQAIYLSVPTPPPDLHIPLVG